MYTDQLPECCGIILHAGLFDRDDDVYDESETASIVKRDIEDLTKETKNCRMVSQMVVLNNYQIPLFRKTLKELGYKRMGRRFLNRSSGNKIQMYFRLGDS